MPKSNKKLSNLEKMKKAGEQQRQNEGTVAPDYDHDGADTYAGKQELPNELIPGTKEYIEDDTEREAAFHKYVEKQDQLAAQNTNSLEQHFKDIFDFESFRAEMYFPRARYWKPELIHDDSDKTIAQKLKLDKEHENREEHRCIKALLSVKARQFEFDRIKKAVANDGEIGIKQYSFDVLIQGNPQDQIKEILENRRAEGFLIAHLFWYMLRANVYHKEDAIDPSQSPVVNASVFEHYAKEFLSDVFFPGTWQRTRINEAYILEVKRKLWPSAHLWAALHGPSINNTAVLKDDDTFFLNLVKRADALYRLGVEHDVYKSMTSKKFDADMILAYDGIVGDPTSIEVPKFTKEEWDCIITYDSPAMAKKRKRQAKNAS